ncbi:hypothetical protein SDRG_11092 [Saprolegnia diclina VS20]|uniref:Uncharacterized protein n=1 Tax=Saprolegnia diclina (strain VS20) TaxID=1156394 RepID=T0QC73_SAPDV|nr:hypothetical protein SDRG_11092 [Saprolegnia diclina VS20]EQC31165.1 hypothetical protein SDRG_11092 [Saprolegnia diclina VS20]|eukprot:XP_008615338.1 hypothetical protein SDRG_11092 [Saprolegnia diclina VS20]
MPRVPATSREEPVTTYKDVLSLLRPVSVEAATGAYTPLPKLMLAGMAEPLEVPPSPQTLRSVAARYIGASQAAIVPACDVNILGDWERVLHRHLYSTIEGIRHDDRLALSHLSIDPQHETSSLSPRCRCDNAIATLVVLLATPNVRALNLNMMQNGQITHAWRGKYTIGSQYALMPPGTSLVGHATKLRGAPPRVALVFYVVRSVIPTAVGLRRHVALRLHALAASDNYGVLNGVQVHRCGRHATPDWRALEPFHTAFLDALLDAGCYDVGLAVYSPMTGIERLLLQSPVPVPITLVGAKCTEYVEIDDDSWPCYGFCVAMIFWPKRHLVNVMGGAAFASAMRSLPAACARMYVTEAASVFATKCMRTHAAGGDQRQLTADHDAMLQLLQDNGDVDCVHRFLRHCATVTATCPLPLLAPWIQHQLAKYGWEPLANALDSLVSRWCSNESVKHAASLVASLAGATDAPVCAPLVQPFVFECIQRLWATVVTGLVQLRTLESRRQDALQRLLIDALYLEHYCDDRADTDRWLQTRLPPFTIRLVDAFVWQPTKSVAEIFARLARRAPCRLLVLLPEALTTAFQHNSGIHISPLVTCILDGLDANKHVEVPTTSLTSLRWLLEQNATRSRIDEAYLEGCWRREDVRSSSDDSGASSFGSDDDSSSDGDLSNDDDLSIVWGV